MNRKKISPDLQMKVRQYLKFIWQEELTQNAEMEAGIIGKLSKTLKDELYTEANGYILNKFSMFFANFSEQMLKNLMYHMRDARFNPGEVIFSENENDDCEIFFLIKGEVQITSNSINRFRSYVKRTMSNLKDGSILGEMGFFTGQTRSVSALSKDFTSLLYIRREDFLTTLKKFPQDYERYCQIRDQISLNRNYLPLNLKCMACKQYDHLAIHCPLLHFNKEYFMMKHAVLTQQKERHFLKRRKTKEKNVLNLLEKIQKAAFLFNENTNINMEENNLCERFDTKNDDYEIPNEPRIMINGESPCEKPDFQIEDDNRKMKTLAIPKKDLRKLSVDSSVEMSASNIYPNKVNVTMKNEDFERFHVFHYYYPEFNDQRLLTNITLSPINNYNNSMKTKFLNFFLDKDDPSMEHQLLMLRKYQEFFNLQEIFEIKKLKNSYFFGEKKQEESPKGRNLWSFYNLVYEALTNEPFKRKMALKKKQAQKTKKKLNKNMLI